MNRVIKTLGRFTGERVPLKPAPPAPAPWYAKDGTPFVSPDFRQLNAPRPKQNRIRGDSLHGTSLKIRNGDSTTKVVRTTERWVDGKVVSTTVETYDGRRSRYRRTPDCYRTDLRDDRRP